MPVGAFLGYLTLSYICAFASLLIGSTKRDISSTNTPVNFSWQFLMAANLFRVLGNVLLIPIAVRLIGQYAGPEFMLFLTVGIGLGIDGLGALAKQFGVLTTNKLAKQIADKLAPTDVKRM